MRATNLVVMKKVLLLLLVATPALSALRPSTSELSTVESKPGALYLEVMGRAGFYSVNFDRAIIPALSVGAGFSFLPTESNDESALYILPVYANLYSNDDIHRAFATAGADFVFGATSKVSQVVSKYSKSQISLNSGPHAVLGFGYEYRGYSGVLFRAAPYLVVGGGSIIPTMGVSIGRAL
jgi:hypothetical protein